MKKQNDYFWVDLVGYCTITGASMIILLIFLGVF